MKIRKFEKNNYKAIFKNWKTLRLKLNSNKEITELEYPEFYDVKITNYCSGWCPYCYQSSVKTDSHYSNILKITKDYFWNMTENQKPFQVAIWGWNPNEHPDFVELLKLYTELWIMPNYTTNGIGLTKEVLEATAKYSGWVAITAHPHLEKYWTEAIEKLYKYNIKINIHIVISDKYSINRFLKIYEKYHEKIDYFVLLPLIEMWRAKNVPKIEYDYLKDIIIKYMNKDKIAFGANFYPYVKKDNDFNLSLYEPEILSKYIDMKDNKIKIYPSSFNLKLLKEIKF